METLKRMSIQNYLVVLFAFGLLFSCEQLAPEETPVQVVEEFVDMSGVALEPEDDPIGARLVYSLDCESDCIEPGSGNYFAITDSKSLSSGINTKKVTYKSYNTEDKFVVKAKYEVVSGPSQAKASIVIQINGSVKEFKEVPSGYTATYSVPLSEGWAKCDLVSFSIVQNGLGSPISFSEDYNLIPVCEDTHEGLILWNKLGSFEEITNSEFGPDLFPGSGMLFEIGKYGNGLFVPQYDGQREVHSPFSPRNVIPLGAFCIEFWYKRTVEDWEGYSFISGAYEDNGIGIVDFTGHSGYVGSWQLFFTINNNSGDWVSRHKIDLGNQQNYSEFFPKDEWIHLAISHDANWTVGQRMKMFRNGIEVIGFNMEFDNGDMAHVGQFGEGGFRIGNFVAWDTWGAGGVIDNIKVWNYAKTDFSDRDTEGH
ncbi:LamG-like jellyroll fold domain-containing protein [Mariniradius saccharolyticus]|nr:LamG-like jellyroll fold domain-containing protein [Mariniradius saccharolyticus]